MSPSGVELRRRIARGVARTRGLAGLAVTLAVIAVVPGVLLIAWLAGRWPTGPGPLALVIVGAAGAGAAAWVLTRRWVLAIDDDRLAAAVEADSPLPDGSLRSVLELGRELPPGVSKALLNRTEAELEERLAGVRPSRSRLGREARRRRNRALAGVLSLTALAVALGLAAPDRARAAWSPLLRPVSHLHAPVLPAVTVEPGDVAVDRGSAIDVQVRAPLRTEVTLHWRAIGDVPGGTRLPVSDGEGAGRLGPVVASTRYWVTAPDGAVSDTFRVDPRDPLLVSRLAVDAVYPRHTGLDPDYFEGDVPVLRVPAGTRLRVRGTATRALTAAELHTLSSARAASGSSATGSDRRTLEAETDGRAFALDWRPAASGAWSWQLSGTDGGEAAGGTLEVEVIPDEAPEVRVTHPGRDTLMPASLRQPVVADAADDYGVAAARLVFRRRGASDSTVTAFPLPGTAPRQLLRGVLDASDLGLVPGDAVEYYVAVRDNAPSPREARSALYSLRLPSMRGLRDRARDEAAAALEEARTAAERSRSLEEATRDLSRSARSSARAAREEQARPGRQGSPSGEPAPLSFEDAAEAREVLDENESMLSEVEALRERMAELQEAVREAGLEDPELRRRMAELRELYERVATPEMRQAVDDLRQAVESLDAEAVQEALEQLASRQDALRQQLEESLEMLRRAAAEQELSALARDADELAAQQEALASAVEGDDPQPTAARAEQQAGLQERAAGLSRSLEALQETLRTLEEEPASETVADAGAATDEAEGAMDRARASLTAEERRSAARSGSEAAAGLRSVAEALDGARASMTEARTRAAQESVRQATEEALALAEREDGIRRALEQAQQQGGLRDDALQELRSEQAAVQEGLEQLGRNLSEAGQRSAMVDRQVRQAVDQARSDMARTMEGLDEGTPQRPIQAAGDAVESLNQLALSLLQNEGRIQQGQQGGDGMQQALQRLAQLAQEQGALNGQLSALAPMGLAEEALAEQLRAVAERQRGIADQVGQVGEETRGEPGEDALLGDLDALAEEADALARELAGGRLDPEVRARQERLFHRLLDAGRSLEQDELSEERVGERAASAPGDAPEALAPELLDTGLRYPVPSAEQLRGLPPAYRALILEYFQRLNRSVPEPDAGGSAGDADSGAQPGGGP